MSTVWAICWMNVLCHIRMFDLKYDLIFALVQRWRLKTHTFHLLCGECTITLEDFALQFGLPVDDIAVMGVIIVSDLMILCYSLLGRSSDDGGDKLTTLRFSWFKGLAVLATLYLELFRMTKRRVVDILLQS
ncbi:hypothetical protein PVK06_033771 [Gossypium arboreum]|uniref:Aminotransferase-like plant mobile domain-containing protein n=1 Tax=Gossypium arboreum TaxID=29729 RepID=A0ABR0NCC0_GOSAR|nr:hypothetical protein PVK06_033771 [Gossypium arboreum]